LRPLALARSQARVGDSVRPRRSLRPLRDRGRRTSLASDLQRRDRRRHGLLTNVRNGWSDLDQLESTRAVLDSRQRASLVLHSSAAALLARRHQSHRTGPSPLLESGEFAVSRHELVASTKDGASFAARRRCGSWVFCGSRLGSARCRRSSPARSRRHESTGGPGAHTAQREKRSRRPQGSRPGHSSANRFLDALRLLAGAHDSRGGRPRQPALQLEVVGRWSYLADACSLGPISGRRLSLPP